MIIDNFQILYDYFISRNYNEILNGSNYLCISIINRLKDNTINYNNYPESLFVYKTLIISDINDLITYIDYIKELCNKLHARAYITTSPRTFIGLNSTLLNNISTLLSNNKFNNDNIHLYQNILDNNCKQNLVIDDDNYHTYILDIDKHITQIDIDKILNSDILKNKNAIIYKTFAGYHILSKQYDSVKMHKFLIDEFNNKSNNKFIDQKGKGCRALLYANI